jgi:hypothetical protein
MYENSIKDCKKDNNKILFFIIDSFDLNGPMACGGVGLASKC